MKGGFMNFNQIDLRFEYRDIIQTLPKIKGEPEMTEFDSSFLCGLLNKFKPSKILEVGIAGGGTTAIIEQCMCSIKQKESFELISIDISEKFYRNNSVKSGYLGILLDEILKNKHDYIHKYFYNHTACYFDNEIGNDVDCLIIDTVHSMPGEIFDLITLLPLLKDGCVVIIHDFAYNHLSRDKNKTGISNVCLLAAVKAEKYFNRDSENRRGIPNIAAFVVDKETRDNIGDLFLSLLTTWEYMPEEWIIQEYRNAVYKYYDKDLCDLFDTAIEMNVIDWIVKGKRWQFPFYWIPSKSKVVIYGAGGVGREFVSQLEAKGDIEIVGWFDSNYKQLNDIKVAGPQDLFNLNERSYDYIIIAVEQEPIALEIKELLISNKLPKEKIHWRNPALL